MNGVSRNVVTRGSVQHGFAALLATALLWMGAHVVAQPVGWTQVAPILVTNNSTTAVTGYQLRMVLDTSTLAPNAADLRFGADSAGATLLDYWIESGAGTANTVVWVKLPALAASGTLTIFRFGGNPSAASASTVNVFDFVDQIANSSTNWVSGGASGAVANSQRGFSFTPKEDVLLTNFGMNVPNSSTRYVTLFNAATQAKVAQKQVTAVAGLYTSSYLSGTVEMPFWLTGGTQYVLTVYSGSSDAYFFGASTQINPKLTYGEMRYCNTCTQDTFPLNSVANFHYGYPDFLFRTKKALTPSPTYDLNALARVDVASFGPGAGAVTSNVGGISCRATCTAWVLNNATVTFTAAPDLGSSFLRWTGATCNEGATSSTCTTSVGNALALRAVFAKSVLNIDNSSAATAYDATTDGVILLRYLLGYRDAALTDNALGTVGSTPLRTSSEILLYLNVAQTLLDVDGDGQTLAMSDGVMILRGLLGLPAASIAAGAKRGSRSDDDIALWISALKP